MLQKLKCNLGYKNLTKKQKNKINYCHKKIKNTKMSD